MKKIIIAFLLFSVFACGTKHKASTDKTTVKEAAPSPGKKPELPVE
jgi:hypothetical protein